MKIGMVNHYSKTDRLNYFKWDFDFSVKPGKTLSSSVLAYAMDKERVHDCDQGGHDVIYYVVGDDGEFTVFRVDHEYGWWHTADGEQEICNEFQIKVSNWDEVRADGYDVPHLV